MPLHLTASVFALTLFSCCRFVKLMEQTQEKPDFVGLVGLGNRAREKRINGRTDRKGD